MNKQDPGIEWTHVYGPETGYTWNVVQGCHHGCQWQMSDGQIANCYAEGIAIKFQSKSFMPDGFKTHYFHPERLKEPLSLKTPAGIFLDSFSDLMGHWVPDDQIKAVLQVCRQADWHTFQLLTKNAPRLLKFDFPANVWVGVSMPPDVMFNHVLSAEQKHAYLARAFDALYALKRRGLITFMSFEPLSWDVAELVRVDALSWAIIGAASDGGKYYQPHLEHYWNLMDVLKWRSRRGEASDSDFPVFYKGNLRPTIFEDGGAWLQEFPVCETCPEPAADQLALF